MTPTERQGATMIRRRGFLGRLAAVFGLAAVPAMTAKAAEPTPDEFLGFGGHDGELMILVRHAGETYRITIDAATFVRTGRMEHTTTTSTFKTGRP